MARNDEHTLNDVLAACLRRRSPAWRGANSQYLTSEDPGILQGTGQPDIIADMPGGAPVAVETEFSPARTVEQDARSRLGRQMSTTGARIENAVALKIPSALKNVPAEELVDRVEQCSYDFAVVSETRGAAAQATHGRSGKARFPETGWLSGGVDDLAGLVEVLAVSERAIAASTDVLQTAVRQAAGRLAQDLSQNKPNVLGGIAADLFQQPGEQTNRMAMAIVANACTFHTTLAGSLGVKDLDSLRFQGTLVRGDVLAEWRKILDVNFWPIFQIAIDILAKIPAKTAAHILDLLAAAAEKLFAMGAASSHDLTGRMFQRLIQDRKFLATYYTRPEPAVLLAELAVGMTDFDWSEPDGMYRKRVADLACGTGTLLAATYHAMIRRYRRAGWDEREIHDSMLERCLIGADIMPAATHLTASMLSSIHADVRYVRTQIYALPYGNHPQVARPCIGALSLLEPGEKVTLFGTGFAAGVQGLGGKGAKSVSEQEMQSHSFVMADSSLDVVIMNPPFTRPTNHEITDESVPSFAGFGKTEAEQEAMSAELKRLRTRLLRQSRETPGLAPPASNGNAGLASNFLDLAHAKLCPGGTLALVMPASLALGKAWRASRTLLARHYEDLLIVSLAGAGSEEKSFSADTGMAEVLVLGRKRRDPGPEKPENADTTWISLHRRPPSAVEARELARVVRRQLTDRSGTTGSAFEVSLGSQMAGSGIRATLADGGCAGVSDFSLAGAAIGLKNGVLPIARTSGAALLPVTKLGALGNRGPLDRDVGGRRGTTAKARGPFEIVSIQGVPTFPTLWAHEASRERKLVIAPDSMGKPKPGRQRDATTIWKTATRLHFNRDFQLNSQGLAACVTPAPAIGGRAWPSFATNDRDWEEPLAAWANTTLGLLSFWWIGSASQSGRTVLTISRLPDLPVLDVRALSATQLHQIRAAFAAVSGKDLLPAHRASEDPVRKELDRLVLEVALGFSSDAMDQVALIREKWCAEPTVHGGKRS